MVFPSSAGLAEADAAGADKGSLIIIISNALILTVGSKIQNRLPSI